MKILTLHHFMIHDTNCRRISQLGKTVGIVVGSLDGDKVVGITLG